MIFIGEVVARISPQSARRICIGGLGTFAVPCRETEGGLHFIVDRQTGSGRTVSNGGECRVVVGTHEQSCDSSRATPGGFGVNVATTSAVVQVSVDWGWGCRRTASHVLELMLHTQN